MMMIETYSVQEFLYESGTALVYRTIRPQDKAPTILKMLKESTPSSSELARFTREFQITKQLNVEGVIQVYDLRPYEKTLFMTLEDFGGVSLDRLAQDPLETETFLNIAIPICTALGQIHQNHIIHKDLNPGNIVWNAESNQVKIIDFGISSQLSRETTAIKNPNVLEGTLSYMSPEQTGRMNRMLDYRTDLYSLGATFYHLLTGHTPFQAEDALELVHAHIAKTPIPPQHLNPSIPLILNDIVLKLMSKTAEDRYQSAFGLKLDLEQCLHALSAPTTDIEAFQIGAHDVSERFQVSQKLYGREKEIQQLLAAFERITQSGKEMLLVAGFSGIGKSVVVHEVQKPIVKQKGYFISGKFDQFKRNIPYASLVQAFQELTHNLLTESDAQINTWKAKLNASLGANAQVIIDVIPEIELIIGVHAPAPTLPPSDAQNRFHHVFQSFVRTFAEKAHPLVIFLDDLQWADTPSLNLIELFLTDFEAESILIIGAYRDNEVDDAHPLILMLQHLQKEDGLVNSITLKPLSLIHTNQLISETLHTEQERTLPLAQLCYRKTQGNPFFLNQLLLSLYKKHYIKFNIQHRYWTWDLNKITQATISDNVVELMIGKLKQLPETTQNVLQLAASLSNQFDIKTLSIINEKPAKETAEELWAAMQEEFVIPIDEIYKFVGMTDNDISFDHASYRFLHDRVQQAAYYLIQKTQQPYVHLKIARLLNDYLTPQQHEDMFFQIVDHFNQATMLIETPEQRLQLAQYNLEAARKAKSSSAYLPALKYIKAGIAYLPQDAWRSQYDMTLQLHLEKGEIEYLNTLWRAAIETFDNALQRAQSVLDRCKIIHHKIATYRAEYKLQAAIDIGLQALDELGIEEQAFPSDDLLQAAIDDAYTLIAKQSFDTLYHLPELNNAKQLMALEIYQAIIPIAFPTGSNLAYLGGIRMASITMRYGNNPFAPAGYMFFATFCLAPMRYDFANAKKFGELSLKLNDDRYQIKSIEALLLNMWGGHLCQNIIPIPDTLPQLLKGYHCGVENGNYEWSGYNASNYSNMAFWGPYCLHEVQDQLDKFIPQLRKINPNMLQAVYAITATTHNLVAATHDWDVLSENIWPCMQSALQSCHDQADLYILFTAATCRLTLANWFHMPKQAIAQVEYARHLQVGAAGVYVLNVFHLHQCIAYCAVFEQATHTEKTFYLQTIQENLKRFQHFQTCAPNTYTHFVWLIQAELARISNNPFAAMSYYDQAAATAEETGFFQNCAWANELAGRFYIQLGKDRFAKIYLLESLRGYAKWGAQAKVTQLQETYPELLNYTITKPQKQPSTSQRQLNPFCTTAASPSQVLDMNTVLKASQTLSQEIVLEKLLQNLMRILIENACAEKGVLILCNEGKLFVQAEGHVDRQQTAILQSQPIEERSDLAQSILLWVLRTQQAVVLDDASKSDQFDQDPYIQAQQPKSVLCQPILHQGKLLGMVYLENNLSPCVFDPQRLEVLQILTSQAAISIDNASLYANLEHKVIERTEQLNQSLQQLEVQHQELKQTQTQLVHSEKMAGLGTLVAGVAHEINNPTNFVYLSSHTLDDELRTFKAYLFDLLDDDADPELLQHFEDKFDRFFISLDTINEGSQRIKTIIQDLRTFSRIDQAEQNKIHIVEGIASTLRLIQMQYSKSIDFKVDFKENPELECWPAQLNQVFMNVMCNACQAIQAKQTTESAGTLAIRTYRRDTNLYIDFEDDGCGMSEDTRKKIFEPFFTTKAVGEGTGMGMSISFGIIQKHRGSIHVKSQVDQGTTLTISLPLHPEHLENN